MVRRRTKEHDRRPDLVPSRRRSSSHSVSLTSRAAVTLDGGPVQQTPLPSARTVLLMLDGAVLHSIAGKGQPLRDARRAAAHLIEAA